MIRFDPQDRIRPTAPSKAFLDHLDELEIFPRRVDAYAFAAAYVLSADLKPDSPGKHATRSELVRVGLLKNETRLSLAAAISNQTETEGKSALTNQRDLLRLFQQYADAGCKLLSEEWSGKSRSQIMAEVKILF